MTALALRAGAIVLAQGELLLHASLRRPTGTLQEFLCLSKWRRVSLSLQTFRFQWHVLTATIANFFGFDGTRIAFHVVSGYPLCVCYTLQ